MAISVGQIIILLVCGWVLWEKTTLRLSSTWEMLEAFEKASDCWSERSKVIAERRARQSNLEIKGYTITVWSSGEGERRWLREYKLLCLPSELDPRPRFREGPFQ